MDRVRDAMSRTTTRPVPTLSGRVQNNPLPFGGPRGAIFGSNSNSLTEIRSNPVVTDRQWKENISNQARQIVRGTRGQADFIYLPPDSFETDSVDDFWEYIRGKIDGALPAHTVIEDWSFINTRL